jgi:hypothetical protein
VTSWLQKGLAPITSGRYKSSLRDWVTFATDNDLLDAELFTISTYDLSRRALVYFIYYLHLQCHKSSSQIKGVLQGLRHDVIRNLLDASVFRDEAVLLARKATLEPARILHQKKRSRQRMAVTIDILDYLKLTLQAECSIDSDMTYLGILLSFNFMLRVSEYCLDPKSPHAFLCSDIVFRTASQETFTLFDLVLMKDPHSEITDIVFDLCSSKADRAGTGRYLYVSRRQGEADSNLITTIINFCLAAKHRSPTEPFLSRYLNGRHKKLHRGMISKALKAAATHFGFDSLYFSTHSLRIGGATTGDVAGRTRPSLCRVGGWSEGGGSDARYRHTTFRDPGILSVRDSGAYLLSTSDLKDMVPTYASRPKA